MAPDLERFFSMKIPPLQQHSSTYSHISFRRCFAITRARPLDVTVPELPVIGWRRRTLVAPRKAKRLFLLISRLIRRAALFTTDEFSGRYY